MKSKLARSSQIIWEELDSSALLINPATGARWALNETAAALWKLCDGRMTARELAAAVSRSADEVTRFCMDFARLGLLTEAPKLVPIPIQGSTNFQSAFRSAPSFKPLGLAGGPRRRPGPCGISGPA